MNPAHLLRPLLESPAAPRLAWTLVHFLWQGAAAAAALTVLLAVLRKASPAARYAAACAVMVLMVLAPVATFIALGAITPAPPGAGSRTAHPRAVTFVADAVPDGSAPDAADATSRSLQQYVVLPWLAGVLALSAWRVGGWVLLRRMVRTNTRPVRAAVQASANALCRRLGVRAAVRLVESTWVQVPSVLGLLRPVVLLPASVLTELSPAQLEAILTHELAHVRRRDYAVNLLQAAAETVLFYHPAVWWVSRQVREQRERCCDEVAADVCGDRVAYARALADLEALRPLHRALALSAGGGSLPRRIRALLGVEEPLRFSRAGPVAAAVVVTGCLLLLPAAARLSAAPEANQPANAKKADEAAAEAPRDEDLVPTNGDYRIGPGDVLTVSISDLTGPGVETVKQTKVAQSGVISLPYIGQVRADGLTELELQKSIFDAYRKSNLIENANVSVIVSEAHQDTFSVIGDGVRGGAYRTGRGDYRLLDALAGVGAGNGVEQVLIIRRPKEKNAAARVIAIPGPKLLAGDPKYNVVIRPGDVVRVNGGEAPQVRLVLRPDGKLTLDGQEATWEQLPALLEKIAPARRDRTVLTLVPSSQEMTLRQVADARARAEALVKQTGLKELQVAYGAPGDARMLKELPQGEGSVRGNYYVGGQAARPGAYAISGRTVTLRQALIAAQLPEGPAKDYEVLLIRKDDDRGESFYRAGLDETLEPGSPNGGAPLHDGDSILLRRREPGRN